MLVLRILLIFEINVEDSWRFNSLKVILYINICYCIIYDICMLIVFEKFGFYLFFFCESKFNDKN